MFIVTKQLHRSSSHRHLSSQAVFQQFQRSRISHLCQDTMDVVKFDPRITSKPPNDQTKPQFQARNSDCSKDGCNTQEACRSGSIRKERRPHPRSASRMQRHDVTSSNFTSHYYDGMGFTQDWLIWCVRTT